MATSIRQSYAVPIILVIGAGIGALTTAAVLARSGLPVTVLEAHVYPEGVAKLLS